MWDWRVMRTDSAEVIHPLDEVISKRDEEKRRRMKADLQARQSFRLIWA